MSQQFNPDPAFVSSLEELLFTASSGQGNHREAYDRLQNLESNPDFYTYCACIMAMENDPNKFNVRMQATIRIKNGMKNHQNCSQNDVVRNYTLQTLSDQNAPPAVVRITAGIIAAAYFIRRPDTGNIDHLWSPDIIGQIIDQLQNAVQNGGPTNGFIRAIYEIAEQNPEGVDIDFEGLSAKILTVFIPLLSNDNLDPASRKAVLDTVVVLVEQAGSLYERNGNKVRGPAYQLLEGNDDLFNRLMNFLNGAIRANDNHVVQHSIRCLYLLFCFEEKMNRFFVDVAKNMIDDGDNALARHKNEYVRLEVVEFWRAVLEYPRFCETSLQVMDQVLRLILSYIKYERNEYQQIMSVDNWKQEDRPEDVKPKQFGRERGGGHKPGGGDDEDDDDDDEVGEWNLRTAAMTALNEFAHHFGDKITGIVMGVIENLINSQNWREVSSAITAFGCIAEGCQNFMYDRLRQVIPFICDIVQNHGEALVKADAVWCLGQYSEFIASELRDNENGSYLQRTLEVICQQMENTESKKVQQAATVALEYVSEQCYEGEMEPYAQQLVTTVANCFGRFQLKNRYILFECVDYLCGALGQALANQQAFETLTGPLKQMWGETPDDSPLIFPLFSCMSAICACVGDMIQPLAEVLFKRAFELGQTVRKLRYDALSKVNGNEELAENMPEENFLVACTDLLSGLFEALGTSIEPLVSQFGADNVMGFFLYCASEVNSEVRQSAIGLLGEVARSCVGFLQPQLPNLYDNVIIGQLKLFYEHPGIASNVTWMLANLLNNQNSAAGPTLDPPQFDKIFEGLAYGICNPPEDTLTMQENYCKVMGIMMEIDVNIVGRMQNNNNIPFGQYTKPWLDVFRKTNHSGDPSGTERAISGMLKALRNDPLAAAPAVHSLFDCCLMLPGDIDIGLRNDISSFLDLMRQRMGNDFNNALGAYNKRKKIYEQYNIR